MGYESEGIYYYANGAAAYQISNQAGVLKRVIIGTTEANGSLTFYDNASANANEFMELAGNQTGVFEINARVARGIRMVAANATKVTVVYE